MSNTVQNAFPVLIPQNHLPVVQTEVGPVDVEKDFEQSRTNLIRIMDTTIGAINTLSMLAQQSQMPEAFDVLNKMIKTYNDQQEQLIRMYRIKAAREEKPQGVQGQNVDNRTQNVFVGTPADLAKVLEKMKTDTEIK